MYFHVNLEQWRCAILLEAGCKLTVVCWKGPSESEASLMIPCRMHHHRICLICQTFAGKFRARAGNCNGSNASHEHSSAFRTGSLSCGETAGLMSVRHGKLPLERAARDFGLTELNPEPMNSNGVRNETNAADAASLPPCHAPMLGLGAMLGSEAMLAALLYCCTCPGIFHLFAAELGQITNLRVPGARLAVRVTNGVSHAPTFQHHL